jgi:hypothetical protein
LQLAELRYDNTPRMCISTVTESWTRVGPFEQETMKKGAPI